MIVGILLNHALSALGLIWIVLSVWKMARGYPVSRWFF